MKIYHYTLIICTLLLFSSCMKEDLGNNGMTSGSENTISDGDVVKGWIRIKLESDSAPLRTSVFTRSQSDSGNPLLDEVVDKLGATEIRRVFTDGGKYAEIRRAHGLHLWYDIKIDESIPVTRAGSELADLPGIAIVEPIYKITPINEGVIPSEYVYMPVQPSAVTREAAPFNDPYFDKQWNLYNTGKFENSIAGADINALDGWKITTGDPEIIVAVIDSGVQCDHPDIADNMWVNEGEIPGNSIDDDGNGYVDDVNGYNFKKADGKFIGKIQPDNHGTHVAGIVAAVNNNGTGVCGIAGGSGKNDGVRLMTVQMYMDADKETTPAAEEMFAYAAENGAVIAQCSWVYSLTGMGTALSEAIDYFIEVAGTDGHGNQTGPVKGGVCIFGAGNTGTGQVFYPARDPRVVGVAAMTADYKIATYSNYGEGIDIYAPGGTNVYPNNRDVYVYSTITTAAASSTVAGYGYMAGTSMATPHVSGVAALIASEFKGPGFTAADLKSRLLRSFRPGNGYVDPKYNEKVGAGLVDASLIKTEIPASGPDQILTITPESAPAGVKITCPVPLDGNRMPVAKFNLKYAEKAGGAWVNAVLINTYPAGSNFVYTVPLKSEVAYKFEMNAVDRYGRETSYKSFECTTAHYANNPPKVTSKFPEAIEFKDAKPNMARFFLMNSYFMEPDAQYGDAITYSAKSSDNRIVDFKIESNNKVSIIPKAKGSCVVTIVATDNPGATTEVAINVTVLDGPEPEPLPEPEPTPGLKLNVYPNPVVDNATISLPGAVSAELSVAIYDSAARLVLSQKVTTDSEAKALLNASKLTPGSYNMVVRHGAEKYSKTIIKR